VYDAVFAVYGETPLIVVCTESWKKNCVVAAYTLSAAPGMCTRTWKWSVLPPYHPGTIVLNTAFPCESVVTTDRSQFIPTVSTLFVGLLARFVAEYTPVESQCHTNTCAPDTSVPTTPLTLYTLMVRDMGMPVVTWVRSAVRPLLPDLAPLSMLPVVAKSATVAK
jgi:hypothetical protein